jgi:hypothetical protein
MLIDRVIGVFKLDVNTFEEIEADQSATSQAAIVVLVVALISALGAGFGASFSDGSFFGAFFSMLISALGGWIIWSVVTYFVGTTFFGGTADLGEMLRVIGFSYAPQVLGIIPCLGGIVGGIWSLVAGFIAVRQGLDLDNTKALLTIIVGFIAYVLFGIVMGLIFGVAAFGFGALANLF